jgi:hypothetical protein
MSKFVQQVFDVLILHGAHKATKFVSPTEKVTATRKLYNGKPGKRTEVVLTIGKPNAREREFIKHCQFSGVPFPVRKVQLKFPPKRK